MNLKRTYTISLDPDVAELIEDYKDESGLSYTDIFIEGLKLLFGEE